MFKRVCTLYRHVVNNNKVVKHFLDSKVVKATTDVLIESNRAPISVFQGLKSAYNSPRVYKFLYPDSKLNFVKKNVLRTKMFGRYMTGNQMKKVYTDPAQIGAVVGCFTLPFPATAQVGYLLGKGLGRGVKVAHDFVKRTQNILI